jgi:hypothetical protein
MVHPIAKSRLVVTLLLGIPTGMKVLIADDERVEQPRYALKFA